MKRKTTLEKEKILKDIEKVGVPEGCSVEEIKDYLIYQKENLKTASSTLNINQNAKLNKNKSKNASQRSLNVLKRVKSNQ